MSQGLGSLGLWYRALTEVWVTEVSRASVAKTGVSRTGTSRVVGTKVSRARASRAMVSRARVSRARICLLVWRGHPTIYDFLLYYLIKRFKGFTKLIKRKAIATVIRTHFLKYSRSN